MIDILVWLGVHAYSILLGIAVGALAVAAVVPMALLSIAYLRMRRQR